ncbi:hypothetical protein [Tritonibacter litoralis]|nr:hypothetical protein [Tritonibacter litoralis]
MTQEVLCAILAALVAGVLVTPLTMPTTHVDQGHNQLVVLG